MHFAYTHSSRAWHFWYFFAQNILLNGAFVLAFPALVYASFWHAFCDIWNFCSSFLPHNRNEIGKDNAHVLRKKEGAMTYKDVLDLEPMKLIEHLGGRLKQIPEDPGDFLKEASGLLTFTANSYSYLTTLFCYAKAYAKYYKDVGKKEKYADMIAKRDIIDKFLSAAKQENQTVSRQITIYLADEELSKIVRSRKKKTEPEN